MTKKTINTNNTQSEPNYREDFANKKTTFKETDMIKHVKKNLKEDHNQRMKTHNQGIVNTFWSILCAVNPGNFEWIDTLGWGGLVVGDIKDDVGAFVMWFSESVTGHGVRSVGQFGVYKGDKVITSNRYTIRGAYASEQDHRELSFNEIKILWTEKNKIIIWLKSGALLTIKEIALDSWHISTVEEYDLAKENREKEKKELEETLNQGLEWKNNLENVKKLIGKNYNYNSDIHSVEDAIIFDDFAIIPVNKHNRNYDAMVTYIDLYVYGKDFKEPKKIKSHYCNYDRSRFSNSRFFSVNARTKIEKIDDKNLKAKIEIRSSGYGIAENDIDISIG